MKRTEKRTKIFSLALGDGSLFKNICKTPKRTYTYGRFAVSHCDAQKDLVEWKARILSEVTGKNVKVRTFLCTSGFSAGKYKHEARVQWRRFKAWHKFSYPNNKKDNARMLRWIDDPVFAAAVWLMDDGAAQGQKDYRPHFNLYTCDQTDESQNVIIEWFDKNLHVRPGLRRSWHKKRQKYYPHLWFSCDDSETLWNQIRHIVLPIKSMSRKFAVMEQRPSAFPAEEIVRSGK
jgi:hypothetical protein